MLLQLVLNSSHVLMHSFATLATRMEQYIQGQSRDLVDQAYTKFVSHIFSLISLLSELMMDHTVALAS